MTESTRLTENRPETGADILVFVTSRTRTRVRRSAVLTTVVGMSMMVAGPASAKVPEGWSGTDPSQYPLQQVLVVLVFFPLLLIALITAAVYAPALIRGERVAPGAAPVEDQWFGGPRGGVRELESGGDRGEQPAEGGTGGAGGRW